MEKTKHRTITDIIKELIATPGYAIWSITYPEYTNILAIADTMRTNIEYFNDQVKDDTDADYTLFGFITLWDNTLHVAKAKKGTSGTAVLLQMAVGIEDGGIMKCLSF